MVSIIVPTYNNEDYILHALYSIFEQKYREYEIIIIDDGSTDSTRDRLIPYWDRIHYHYQGNQGLAVARNRGLEEARGEFITYLDADDIWLPDNLWIKVEVLLKHPEIGGVFSDFSVFDEVGTIHPRGTKYLFPFFRRTGKDLPKIFSHEEKISDGFNHEIKLYFGHVFSELFWGNFILPSSMVFRRNCALETGYFTSHMRTQQDYEYWLRFSRSYPLAYLDEVLVRYRRHQRQLTNYANIARIFETVIEVIDAYEIEFGQNGKIMLFNRRKSELLAELAAVYISQGRSHEARRLLRESKRLYPWQPALYFRFLLTLLPPGAVSLIRKIRGLLRCSETRAEA